MERNKQKSKNLRPIIFLNDNIPFKIFKSKYLIIWLFRILSSQLKIILPMIKTFLFGENLNKKFKFLKNYNIKSKSGLPISVIIKESFNDYRIQTSRESLIYKNIDKKNSIEIFSSNYSKKIENLKFSIFLKCQANQLNNILISGFISTDRENSIERFNFNIDRKTIQGFERPTYWLDLKIEIKNKNLIKQNGMIYIYLDQIIFDDTKIDNPIISVGKPKNKKDKKILILSFDGVSAEDLESNKRNKSFPNLNKFIEENHYYENAITSSTVTASSAASLITGLNLSEHMIFSYGDHYLAPGLSCLSSHIKTLGEKANIKNINTYGLFAFGKWAPQYGYARGFNHYRSINSGSLQNYPWLEDTLKVISTNKKDSFLYAMHHPGGHPPYNAILTNEYSNLEFSSYQENLKNIDLFLGSVFDQLKRDKIYEETLIFFIADHGSSLASNYNRNKFQFTQNRLRVPLIVKHPDWFEETPDDYSLSRHLSVQTTVHEIISEYIGLEKPQESDIKKRTINGISWLCETMDYSRNNYIGLVGFNERWKYTLYYKLNPNSLDISSPIDCQKYLLGANGFAGNPEAVENKSELERISKSSHKYLLNGLEFSNKFPPENLQTRLNLYSK